MVYDNQNVFAQILRGEAHCHKVFEDEHTLAFMDIMPQVDGHTLVIPKQPAVTIFELTPDEVAACMKTTQLIAKAVKQAFNSKGIAIAQLNGVEAGQSVFHVHFHVLPGSIKDILNRPHAAILEEPEKLADFASRIIQALKDLQ